MKNAIVCLSLFLVACAESAYAPVPETYLTTGTYDGITQVRVADEAPGVFVEAVHVAGYDEDVTIDLQRTCLIDVETDARGYFAQEDGLQPTCKVGGIEFVPEFAVGRVGTHAYRVTITGVRDGQTVTVQSAGSLFD